MGRFIWIEMLRRRSVHDFPPSLFSGTRSPFTFSHIQTTEIAHFFDTLYFRKGFGELRGNMRCPLGWARSFLSAIDGFAVEILFRIDKCKTTLKPARSMCTRLAWMHVKINNKTKQTSLPPFRYRQPRAQDLLVSAKTTKLWLFLLVFNNHRCSSYQIAGRKTRWPANVFYLRMLMTWIMAKWRLHSRPRLVMVAHFSLLFHLKHGRTHKSGLMNCVQWRSNFWKQENWFWIVDEGKNCCIFLPGGRGKMLTWQPRTWIKNVSYKKYTFIHF